MNIINYSDSLTEQMLIYQQNWSYYNHEQEQEPTSILSNYYPTSLNFYQPNYISQPERDCINNHVPIKPDPITFDHPTYRPYQSHLPNLLPLPDYFPRDLPINSASSTNSYPSPDRPHGCRFPGCNRYFKRLEHVKRHYRSIHTKLRPYPCPHCPKSFSRSDNLAQHARVHRQSQPLAPRSPLTTSDPPSDRPLNLFSPHPSSLTATATTTTTNSP